MRSQIVTAYQETPNPSSQILMISQNKRNTSITPYAFTEQGVAMLSGVLRSEKAINMNIAIMRAFVDVRKILFKQNNLNEQLLEIKAVSYTHLDVYKRQAHRLWFMVVQLHQAITKAKN